MGSTEMGGHWSTEERRSAVKRKRAAGNPGGKPTNVKTFA